MAQFKVSTAYIKPKTTTKCKPKTCPTCGGVECFERPRFFCGQLLTDKDLDAAQRYVIEKNKLHNRHIVGTGVVCGLPVRCHPCDGVVVIEPGYAIDCCGNDIVVCESYEFDVVDYIRKCFKKDDPGCEGKIRPSRPSCDDRPMEYCLIISYAEEPSRPVSALVRNGGCSTKKCEPSRTKEGFRVDLVVKETDAKDKARDDFWSHVGQCFTDVLKITRKFFADVSNAQKNSNPESQHSQLMDILCRLEDDILKLHSKGADVRCTIAEELAEIESRFPASRNELQYEAKVFRALFSMFGRLLQFLIDCICDALLVPCPECDEEGVLLACVTVNGGKIEKICNIVRTQVVTGPALRYFLQPLYTALGRVLEFICCELDLAEVFDRLFRIPDETVPGTGTIPGTGTVPSPATGATTDRASGIAGITATTSDTGATEKTETPGNTDTAGNTGTTGKDTGTAEQRGTSRPVVLAQTVEAAFTRGESAVRLGRDYSASALLGIRTANLLQFTNPNVVTAMDVYGVPLNQASESLGQRGVKVSRSRQATSDAEAYGLGNLLSMSWVVPPGSEVELIVAPDSRVTAIRVIEGNRK